jgi:hypothetical protein
MTSDMNAIASAASSPPTSPPWYRQAWPWLLMAGPAIVVVAGFVTLWLALASDDGLVAEDYYKRGLLINREIERENRAAGVEARVIIAGEGAIVVSLDGLSSPAPQSLRVRFAHATRAGLDRTVQLARSPDGSYRGVIEGLPAGRWLVTLQTDAWRTPTVEVSTPVREFHIGGAGDRP